MYHSFDSLSASAALPTLAPGVGCTVGATESSLRPLTAFVLKIYRNTTSQQCVLSKCQCFYWFMCPELNGVNEL